MTKTKQKQRARKRQAGTYVDENGNVVDAPDVPLNSVPPFVREKPRSAYQTFKEWWAKK